MDRVSASADLKTIGVSPRKKLETACREFEGFFVAEMLKKNMATVPDAKGEGEGQAFGPLEETSMEMVARSLSSRGEGMGLWKVLYEALSGNLPQEDSLQESQEEPAKGIHG